MKSHIEIIHARENNLKNVSVKIPRDKLTVITGVSGSGKSSLAYDVLYAEGQRRFLDTLSAYARSRMPQLKRPDVEFIKGLSPIINIDQKRGISNPRSTLGTLTDIANYLRLLYSVAGEAFCPYCNHKIEIKTPGQLSDTICTLPEGTVIEVRAVLFKVYDEDYKYILDKSRNKGYRRFRIDGKVYDAGEAIDLDEYKEYRVEAIIDKFTVLDDIHKQVNETIENAFEIGHNFISIDIIDPDINDKNRKKFNGFSCPEHHIVCGELSPRYFNPNDPESACATCSGLGNNLRSSRLLMVENENKSLLNGALDTRLFKLNKIHRKGYNQLRVLIYSLCNHYKFSWDTPYKDLSDEIKDILFNGSKGEKIPIVTPHGTPEQDDLSKLKEVSWTGILQNIDHFYKMYTKRKKKSNYWEDQMKKVMVEQTCPDCNGVKLNRYRQHIKINGKTLHEANRMPLEDLYDFLINLNISETKKHLANPVIEELLKRLKVMNNIGLEYLNIDRRTETLSGGELQRTKLSTQISSELMGLMFILDEPSIGLHSRDSGRLINVMKEMRDLGNTVIVIEHDVDTILAADHVIEIGPGSGIHGGEIVEQGSIAKLKNSKKALTGAFLSGKVKIKIPDKRRPSNGKYLHIKGARENNLKNIDVKLPLGIFICVTGVSGSGKSSLIHEILCNKLSLVFRHRRVIPGDHDEILGIENIKDIRYIDQTTIGNNIRSNPATYIGFYDRIREIYSELDESKERGYKHMHFSFNGVAGRCPECMGWGRIITPLQYMADIESTCPACNGARFRKEILEVKYKNKNIADVLDMSVDEALEFFSDIRYLAVKLKVMQDLGLGYLTLGQPATTISGGEAQRIKLVKEIAKIKRESDNLYVMDEPTTGLHLADIQRLLDTINHLVDSGNTVIVIEHNLEVIKSADYVIDIGPEGGKLGGNIVAQGTPEDIARVKESYTGQFLRKNFFAN